MNYKSWRTPSKTTCLSWEPKETHCSTISIREVRQLKYLMNRFYNLLVMSRLNSLWSLRRNQCLVNRLCLLVSNSMAPLIQSRSIWSTRSFLNLLLWKTRKKKQKFLLTWMISSICHSMPTMTNRISRPSNKSSVVAGLKMEISPKIGAKDLVSHLLRKISLVRHTKIRSQASFRYKRCQGANWLPYSSLIKS